MFYSWKKNISICLLFFCANLISNAQKIDITNFENKAKGYVILSAQYSKDAYYSSKTSYFLSSTKAIRHNCDTGIVCAQIAMEYADSAINMAYDTCISAKKILLNVKKYQQKIIENFKQINKGDNIILIHNLLEKSMYLMGNAIVDTYKASLLIESEKKKESTNSENKREITRLEVDEFSYMTIKELYRKRLIENKNEIFLLEAAAKKSSQKKVIEINNAISQLKEETKGLLTKMKNSEDKLINVKNDLSEEMLKVVNKDIFTTEKKDFYNKDVPVPVNAKTPKGLVYKVQIGFFKSQLPPQHFNGIFPVSSEKIDNVYYRYVAGNFSKYKEAKAAKMAISEKGYTDSFVIAYIDGKKVSISEALREEKENN